MKSLSAEKKKISKILFQLYPKFRKRLQKHKNSQASRKKKICQKQHSVKETSILQWLKYSLRKMKVSQKKAPEPLNKIFADLPQPTETAQDIRIGIYAFDHGCADYLKTHDCSPQILLSMVLADKATHYATRFWAEIFGFLQIAVAFVVTFFLQFYRFVLYSLINILLVEFLHMTSDYLVKPLLTVIFNDFLQPPMIFCFNILSSIRDILEPIADTVNNFMKPVATVGRSIRLIHATYKKNIANNV